MDPAISHVIFKTSHIELNQIYKQVQPGRNVFFNTPPPHHYTLKCPVVFHSGY